MHQEPCNEQDGRCFAVSFDLAKAGACGFPHTFFSPPAIARCYHFLNTVPVDISEPNERAFVATDLKELFAVQEQRNVDATPPQLHLPQLRT